jgi:hypothetical protein
MGQQTCGAAKLSRPQREALLALLDYAERCGRSALNTTVASRVAAPLQMLRPGGRRTTPRVPPSPARCAAWRPGG